MAHWGVLSRQKKNKQNRLIFWSLSIIGMNVTGVNSGGKGVRGGWLKATRESSQ